MTLRQRLLLGILVPLLLLSGINTVVLYRQALRAADTAYDRTLLASAKSIGELLEVAGSGPDLHVRASLPYAALEPFEADNRSRLYYRVLGFQGEVVSGFPDLPGWRGRIPDRGIYAALVDFYDDRYREQPVRMAVLLQPVAGPAGQGMATIQVAETLELRRTLAGQLLVDTVWRQALMVVVIGLVVVVVVQLATRPVRELSTRLTQRAEGDLSPIESADAPRELQPLLDATNQVMGRLAHLLEHQKRFVRDTSHQLRTPLAVLRAQVQSARRGDVEPAQALAEIEHTVDGATVLANQMLALARVEQLHGQDDAPWTDWAGVVRAVALDLSPLIADRALDFSLEADSLPVLAHEWSLRELTRNLLHNAVKFTPAGAMLSVTLAADGDEAVLTVADDGPGLTEAQRSRLFQPFASGGHAASGSGLGLAICDGLVRSLGGRLRLDNRPATAGRRAGLDAVARLPRERDRPRAAAPEPARGLPARTGDNPA